MTPEIAAALVAAQGEMPAALFDATNPFLKNRYATLGSLIQTAKPVLAKHGLAVIQTPYLTDGRVGVHTILVHKSGATIDLGRIDLPLGEERGKSVAQVMGSIITYIRRYQFAPALRMYAEEDDDGNAAPEKSPARTTASPPPRPASTEDVAPTEPPTPTEKTKAWWLECLKPYADQALAFYRELGVLGESQSLAEFPIDKCPRSRASAEKIMAEIQKSGGANTAAEVPDAWRSMVVPFGKSKGATLGDLPKNVLFGFWANFVVESEYEGKPLSPERIERDKAFRSALDEAGKHYAFNV